MISDILMMFYIEWDKGVGCFVIFSYCVGFVVFVVFYCVGCVVWIVLCWLCWWLTNPVSAT